MAGLSYTTSNVAPGNLIPCYIVNKLTGDTIQFMVLPEEVTESYSVSMEPKEIMGRSAPYISYSGNEARTVGYSITLHEDIVQNMMTVIDKLKRLVYPKYTDSHIQPPYQYVKFGDMIDMMAVVTSVSLSWGQTIIEDQQHYSQCEVSLEFMELRISSLPSVDANPFQEGNM